MNGEEQTHWRAPQRPRLLLVDDDAGMRRSATRFLSRAGFDVIEAESGVDAVALLDVGQRFDAAVIDLEMPGMNGVQVMAAIKRRQPNLPMGIWSANVGADTSPEADFADAWFVISKLDSIGALVQAVAEAIYGARALRSDTDGGAEEPNKPNGSSANGAGGHEARALVSSYHRTLRPPPVPQPYRLQA